MDNEAGRHTQMEKAVGLTKYFVSLPRARVLAASMLVVAVVFGIALAALTPDNIFEAGLTSFYVLAVPGFISIIIGKAMMMKVPIRRITAVALIGELIYALTYLAAISLPMFGIPLGLEVVFLGSAFVLLLWYIIGRIVFVLKWRSLLFAFLQLLLYAFFLITDGLLPFEGSTESVLVKFYAASLILLGALFLFFWIINAPMKRTFGVASTDAVSMFFGQWFYNAKDIEKAFRKVGEDVQTYLSVFLFRKKGKEIAFVVPYVHFGPFGELGGSNFSYLIAKALGDNGGKRERDVFVFHGLATHDINPVSVTELKNITDKCKEIISGAKMGNEKVAFIEGKEGECRAECLRIGDAAFIGLTRAPETCEDFSLGMGIALTSEAEKKVRLAAIADEHNSETGEIQYVEPGTPFGFRYMEAVGKACGAKVKGGRLRVGSAEGGVVVETIGPAGIKVAVFGTEPKYVIILADANGVTPAFRERIMEEVKRMFMEKGWGKVLPALYTTDTHKVNTVKGVVNPLKEDGKVMEKIMELVAAAYEDIGDAEFYGERALVEIKALGAKQAIGIVSTVNAIVAVARIAAPLIIFGGIIATLWVISKI
ncbi:MAG: DUF2070 family protein [Candidatus Micrarchaeia archaeon]|jgi:predicted neutral ceramidase superfamily lipid hydrolase